MAGAFLQSSKRLRLIARIDLLDAGDDAVIPVEYKKGAPRSQETPLWEPELVQICAQALILRDSDYQIPYAEAFFDQTRTRHRIEITDNLVQRTLAAVEQLRIDAAADHPSPPLIDSPKCPQCSLVRIYLPGEVEALRDSRKEPARRLVAADPAATPLYATRRPRGR